MKKIIFLLIIIMGISGCSSQNKEIEELKKENDDLKIQIQNSVDTPIKVDLEISGDFSLYLYDIGEDYELGESDFSTLTVGFYQSQPFLLRTKKEIALKLTVGKAYTFQFKNPVQYNGVDYYAYEHGYISRDSLIQNNFERLELVGKAKENELGLSSDRIKMKIIENK